MNFDTLGESFQTISSIATREGWIEVLWDTVDSKGIDEQPQRDYRLYFGRIYTMILLFVITLLFMNLFIGVVMETFSY